MSILDSIYPKLPVFAQHVAVSAFGYYWKNLRFGPGYEDSYQEYRQREHFTEKEWQEWQSGQLKALLPLCIDHVPYYRDHWSSAQKQSAKQGEIGSLPILNKEPLRSDPRSFLRDDIHPKKPQVFLTSGSTGTPISSFFTIPELRRSLALREVRSARWAGVSFSQPRATFSGRMAVPDPNTNGPFYRFNLAEKQVYLSPFHLRPDTAHQYVDAIRGHNIQWGTGYAVSFYLLARFMLEQNITSPGMKAIITTSEKLTSEMRSIMERAYGCRIYEEYSTVENAIFASECEHGRLHVSPDVSLTEILRPDGSACLPGEAGEVVVTTLSRSYQPLIRFRLGDIAMWDTKPCPCGREMPVIKEVIGRIEDVVIGPDGRQMVRFHGIFVNQPHVIEGQIIQETQECIRVKILPTSEFSADDIADITHRVQQRLGWNTHVIVEPVNSIPRTKAGKFQAVISLLKESAQTS